MVYDSIQAITKGESSSEAERRRLYTDSLLPDFLREEMNEKLAHPRQSERIMDLIRQERQTIFWGQNKFGHLFLLLPFETEPDEGYAQLVFSKSYAFEILLRYLTGGRITRQYANRFLLSLREEAQNLSSRVPEPYPFHRLADSFIKDVCTDEEKKKYLPPDIS